MAILEGLGPSKKVFEDLEVGDYLFEIIEPSQGNWIQIFTDKDDEDSWRKVLNFRLKVLRPEDQEGRTIFHSVMFDASPKKIGKAKKPYDPSVFLYRFLNNIGAGVLHNGEVTLKEEYLTDGEIDPDKLIGIRFWGHVGLNTYQDQTGQNQEIRQIDKIWLE